MDFRVAVIGMACRVPGADDWRKLARNLEEGGDYLTRLSREALIANGVPLSRVDHPRYVTARGVVEGYDRFDNEFFGISAADATDMDPQHRMFLMTAYHALEDAGYASPRLRAQAGVFGACTVNSYTTTRAEEVRELINSAGEYLSTRLSYKLDLRGPSMTVSTACSSSLVAVTQAIQALVLGQCDLALAGGASLGVPIEGYVFQEGSILSGEGTCRAFDARSAGTVPGDGVAVVVLKRLPEAIRDGDAIRAVITGFGLTNDGGDKIGFSAPSVSGQAAAISAAHAMAGITPEDIGYVEAHGTGTTLGDAVEIAALKEVFGQRTGESCALGSLKSSIGHLDAASGVAGLIKTVLSVEQGRIYPSANVETTNPELGLEEGGFYVPRTGEPWSAPSRRRAGVSSFGVGGTNVHLVVEQPPDRPGRAPEPGPWPVLLSARNPESLQKQVRDLAEAFETGIDVGDAAYTLATGRDQFTHRYAVVAHHAAEAARLLHAAVLPSASRGATVTFDFPATSPPSPELVRRLLGRHSGFQDAWRSCVSVCAEFTADAWADEDEGIVTCAYQYSLARAWSAYGAVPKTITSAGPGALAAAAFTVELSLAEALRSAGAAPALPPDPVSPDSIATIRITMGAPGQVWVDDREVTQAGEGDPVVAGLAAIWQAGIAVRLEPLFDGAAFSRIPLPAYSFRTQRFWHAADPVSTTTAPPTAQDPEPGPFQAGAPRTPDVLAQLLAAWEQVLGEPAVTADTDFYEAGGDSLAALEVVAEVERLFGVVIEVDDVYADPTPGSLALRISGALSGEGGFSRVASGGPGPDSTEAVHG